MRQGDDLTRGGTALLLWCLPVAALIAGNVWPAALPWLWIPALLVMGTACLVNAARCGRTHCYFTGPLFVLAALYVLLAEFGLVPLRAGVFLDVVLVLTLLAFLAERPLGKYGIRKKP